MTKVTFYGQIDVFSISENKYLRSCSNHCDLSELGNDEYFSFSMRVQNNADHAFAWKQAYVRVDGMEPWRWTGGQIRASDCGRFRVAYRNMKKCMTLGAHTVVWYFDGQAVHKERFIISRNMKWETVFPMPSRNEIANYRNPNKRRSPYLAGWLGIPAETRYTEYMIDFKATHLPRGTYCCLGNWAMDYSSLKKRYKTVRTEYGWTHAYAGLQKTENGQMVSIMSFWEIYCQDFSGKETTIRAKRLYPKTVVGADSFSGEGSGARSIVPFDWKAGHWYRMHLKCIPSPATGTTLVEQWIHDIETEECTLLCRYDTGVADSTFKGNMAIFLENFLPETAGEVRSMEAWGARYLRADTKQWQTITSAYLEPEDGVPQYEGSYQFGVSENRIWMIASGVGGDWFHNGKGKRGTHFKIANE